jgi:hypothetical protein
MTPCLKTPNAAMLDAISSLPSQVVLTAMRAMTGGLHEAADGERYDLLTLWHRSTWPGMTEHG